MGKVIQYNILYWPKADNIKNLTGKKEPKIGGETHSFVWLEPKTSGQPS